MIKSKLLKKYSKVSHGFFNKIGGVSKGIYKSLNCGLGSKDKPIYVNKNLSIACKAIGAKRRNLILLNQIHSNKFHLIKEQKKNYKKRRIIGDALITKKKKIALGILTADCIPVFIYDPTRNIIAAIHSGWKGSFKGISEKVIKKLKKLGSKTINLKVVIGPCISKNNYEIKDDFLKKFKKKDKKNKLYFKKRKNRKFFDMTKYVVDNIKSEGIKEIEIIKKDTFPENNNFFSARRALKKNENDYGRNISIIMLN